MPEQPCIARMIVELVDAMPTRFDPVEVRVAWIRHKAAVMRQIATETDDPRIARQATAEADRADRQATKLDTGNETGP
jgi:hypothetical protein